MDLGAYAQIDTFTSIAEKHGINVPRLRGYRYMGEEQPLTDDDMSQIGSDIAVDECEGFLRSPHGCKHIQVYSSATNRRVKKYMIRKKVGDYNGHAILGSVGVDWSKVHGKLRKEMRFVWKNAMKRTRQQFGVFNKYAGRSDVLYIHARIGGNNWKYYGGPELAKQPWFLEKVDDAFDSTYCDIYAKIEPISEDQKGAE